MIASIRRVVTGLDSAGRSCVVSDGPVATEGTRALAIWDAHPSDLRDQVMHMDVETPQLIEPAAGSARWRYVRIPPHEEYLAELSRTGPAGFDAEGYHITRTVDLCYITRGELHLDLDTESVRLSAGDCVVQQATRHAWRSVSGAEMLAVMIAVLPPEIARRP